MTAAVQAGAKAMEMAVVDSSVSEDGRTRTFELVTAGDEAVRVVAVAKGSGPSLPGARSYGAAGGAGAIELSASVGRFGDAEAERKLLRAVRRRLEQLSGVDSAPLPDDARDLLR